MDLNSKIDLVLAEEYRRYGLNMGYLGSLNLGIPPAVLSSESIPNSVKSENVDRLLRLHSMITDSEKRAFTARLLLYLERGLPYEEVAYLIFLALHRLGETIPALTACNAGLMDKKQKSLERVFVVLANVVVAEYGQFSVTQCQELLTVLRTFTTPIPFNNARGIPFFVGPAVFGLPSLLNQTLLKHLDAELSDANPEIFADRDRVLSIWERLFGDTEVPRLVHQIDQYFREGEREPTALATCVDRLRVLIVTASRAIASRCAQRDNARPLTADSAEAVLFQHLLSVEVISRKEWNILRSLHGLTSEVGAHSITANLQDARLIKNMTYEFLLLMLSRVEA